MDGQYQELTGISETRNPPFLPANCERSHVHPIFSVRPIQNGCRLGARRVLRQFRSLRLFVGISRKAGRAGSREMKAVDALRISRLATIHARFDGGVAIIHQSDNNPDYIARFIFRNAEEKLTFDGMKSLGTFGCLEDAVQIVEESIGSSTRLEWSPDQGIEIRVESGAGRPTGTGRH